MILLFVFSIELLKFMRPEVDNAAVAIAFRVHTTYITFRAIGKAEKQGFQSVQRHLVESFYGPEFEFPCLFESHYP